MEIRGAIDGLCAMGVKDEGTIAKNYAAWEIGRQLVELLFCLSDEMRRSRVKTVSPLRPEPGITRSLVLVPDRLVSRKVKIPMTCFKDIDSSGRAFTH